MACCWRFSQGIVEFAEKTKTKSVKKNKANPSIELLSSMIDNVSLLAAAATGRRAEHDRRHCVGSANRRRWRRRIIDASSARRSARNVALLAAASDWSLAMRNRELVRAGALETRANRQELGHVELQIGRRLAAQHGEAPLRRTPRQTTDTRAGRHRRERLASTRRRQRRSRSRRAPQPQSTGVVGARVVGVVAASALGVGANETERETKRETFNKKRDISSGGW